MKSKKFPASNILFLLFNIVLSSYTNIFTNNGLIYLLPKTDNIDGNKLHKIYEDIYGLNPDRTHDPENAFRFLFNPTIDNYFINLHHHRNFKPLFLQKILGEDFLIEMNYYSEEKVEIFTPDDIPSFYSCTMPLIYEAISFGFFVMVKNMKNNFQIDKKEVKKLIDMSKSLEYQIVFLRLNYEIYAKNMNKNFTNIFNMFFTKKIIPYCEALKSLKNINQTIIGDIISYVEDVIKILSQSIIPVYTKEKGYEN